MADDIGWAQQALFAQEMIETRLSIGWIPSVEHLQLQVETFNPATKELLDMWAKPHVESGSASAAVISAVSQAAVQIAGQLSPEDSLVLGLLACLKELGIPIPREIEPF